MFGSWQGSAIPEETVFFAVKTWSGFHETRARVVKKTWGRHVTNLQFYSDKDGQSINALVIFYIPKKICAL